MPNMFNNPNFQTYGGPMVSTTSGLRSDTTGGSAFSMPNPGAQTTRKKKRPVIGQGAQQQRGDASSSTTPVISPKPDEFQGKLAEAMIGQYGKNLPQSRTPWEAIGQGMPYMAAHYRQQQDAETKQARNKQIADMISGADSRSDLVNALISSGDPKYMQAGIEARLKQPERTNAMQEYEYAKNQGYEGSFNDWRLGTKSRYDQNDAGQVIDKFSGEVVEQGRDPATLAIREEEGKQTGKARAERRSKIYDDAKQAVINNRMLNRMEELNKEATTGGWLAGADLTGKRMLQFMGIEPESVGLEDNASATEALQALSTRSALDVSQDTKGAITEREMDLFIQSVPSLLNTKEGNQLIIDFLRTANSRRIALNRRAVEYVQQNGTLDEGFADIMGEIYANNPIPDLSEYAQPEEGQQGGAIEPGTQVDDPSTLPEGAKVRDENGQRFIIRNGQAVPIEDEPGPGGYAR